MIIIIMNKSDWNSYLWSEPKKYTDSTVVLWIVSGLLIWALFWYWLSDYKTGSSYNNLSNQRTNVPNIKKKSVNRYDSNRGYHIMNI